MINAASMFGLEDIWLNTQICVVANDKIRAENETNERFNNGVAKRHPV